MNNKPQRASIWLLQQKLTKAAKLNAQVLIDIMDDKKRKDDEEWKRVLVHLEEVNMNFTRALNAMDALREFNAKLKEQAK